MKHGIHGITSSGKNVNILKVSFYLSIISLSISKFIVSSD